MGAVGWKNWSGTVSAPRATVRAPSSEAEIVTIVRDVRAAGGCVRPVGAGHSFTPLVSTEGVLLSLEGLSGVINADARSMSARVLAGTRIRDMGEPLRAAGLALENQGDVDVQAIGGAVSTGTHGTGSTLGSLSTQLQAARLVGASGEIFESSRQDTPDIHGAVQLSLGALGVLTELALSVVPAYRLHERIWKVGVAEALADLADLTAKHRHLEFFWWPGRDRVELKALDPTEVDPDPLENVGGERIDHSHVIFPTERELVFNEIEYAVEAEKGPECFSELRACMQKKHPDVGWPIEYRTVAADDIWLSPAFECDVVAISAHQDADVEYRPFFADVEAVFRNHAGRPHWAKLHTLGPEDLADLYPRFGDFVALRRELDPTGIFLNDYLRRLLGE